MFVAGFDIGEGEEVGGSKPAVVVGRLVFNIGAAGVLGALLHAVFDGVGLSPELVVVRVCRLSVSVLGKFLLLSDPYLVHKSSRTFDRPPRLASCRSSLHRCQC